jgi:4-hydroxy-tetrahydrodipicolinate synthase
MPTPLTEELQVDQESVARLVEHHVRLGINGVLVAGTRGEGICLTEQNRRELLEAVVQANGGRMLVAMQVTENSEPRIAERAEEAAELGADIAVMASPYFHMRPTHRRLRNFFLTCIGESALPVGLYDRGTMGGGLPLPEPAMVELCQEEKVVMLKDSSRDKSRRAMALLARMMRSELSVLSGDEYTIVGYLACNYDGFLLGGASFIGYLAGQVMEAWRAEDRQRAEELDRRMQEILNTVYGGPDKPCWLAGDKALLQEMGLLESTASYWDFGVTDKVREELPRLLDKHADVLLP